MIRKSLLLTAALALSTSALSAGLVWTPQQNFSYSNLPNNTVPFPDQSIIITPFDTNLGPLTAVRFHLTGTINGSQSVDNDDTQSVNATVTSAITMTLSLDAFGNLVVAIPTETHNPTLGADDGGPIYTGADSFTNAFSGVTDSATQIFNLAHYQTVNGPVLGPLFWAAFQDQFDGPGNITLDLTSSGVTQASGGGNLNSNFQTFGSVQGYVQYQYDSPVPEPGTYAMLGGGLAFLGLIGRRRRAQ